MQKLNAPSSMVVNQPMEVFVAARATTDSPHDSSYLFESGYNNNALAQSPNSNSLGTYETANGPSAGITPNTDFVADAYFNGANSLLMISGGPAQTGNPGTGGSSGGVTIGNYGQGVVGHSWGGLIYEVVVYNRALSSSERTQVVQYMTARYGITFLPTSLSGCVQWLRSDAGVTLSGNTVSKWADQSGNANDVSPDVAANGPGYSWSGGGNNQPYTSWTSLSAQKLNAPSSMVVNQPMEVIVAARATTDSPHDSSYLFESGYNNNALAQSPNSNSLGTYETTNGPSAGITPNADFVADAYYNGANSLLMINGGPAQTGNPGTGGSSGGVTIGNYGQGVVGHSWGGLIYEVLVYNRALSSSERSQIVQYMTARYGIGQTSSSPPAISGATSVPGCVQWLRSDTGVTVSSSIVTAWADQSGFGRNVSPDTASDAPAYVSSGGGNNQPYTSWTSLSHQQLNSASSFSASEPIEVFVVARATTSNPSDASDLFETGYSNHVVQQAANTSALTLYQYQYGPSAGIGANKDFIADAYFNGTNSQLSINGGPVQIGNTGTGAVGGTITVGNYGGASSVGHSWGGYIYEVAMYDRRLSALERAQMLQYMSARYNIALTAGAASVPGCVLWLKSDRGITLNGSNVSVWPTRVGTEIMLPRTRQAMRHRMYRAAGSTTSRTHCGHP
jgi:hypothetical protein